MNTQEQKAFDQMRWALEQLLPMARKYGELFGSINPWTEACDMGEIALTAAKEVQAQVQPCIGKDPLCPCQDGDACHYKDVGHTKAWPVPTPQAQRLSDDEVQVVYMRVYNEGFSGRSLETAFARAIETAFAAKNGIHLGD